MSSMAEEVITRYICKDCGRDCSAETIDLDEGRKKCTKRIHRSMPVKRIYFNIKGVAAALRLGESARTPEDGFWEGGAEEESERVLAYRQGVREGIAIARADLKRMVDA